VYRGVLEQSKATGNLVHDAHIAALCIEHGVSELLTADTDFARFRDLRVRNPFL
jgi:predicted nucleic acid-binding protein